MTLLQIARLGRPVLVRPAAPVTDFADPALTTLVADMVETLADSGGVGLAAPQVHRSVRVILALPIEDAEDDAEDREPLQASGVDEAAPLEPVVLVNPVLEDLGEGEETAWEGCLSIPGLRGPVPRPRAVRYRGQDPRGGAVAGEARGMFARILQHEVDHLDGILFLQRLNDLRNLAFDEEFERLTEGR